MNDRGIKADLPKALLLFILACLAGCPTGTFPSYDVVKTEDVVYGVGVVSDGTDPPVWFEKELLLDVYEPEGYDDMDKAAVLLIHGGSFVEGSKEKEEIVDFAEFFARRGYVAFAMNYRLRDDYPPAPESWDAFALTKAAHAAVVDAKAAVRFIRANAAAYGIATDRIGLIGESAGAIAGIAVAVTAPLDFATDGPDFPIPESNYPDASPEVRAYVHLWGSAAHVLDDVGPDTVPIMIVHGTEDDNPFTPFINAETLHLLLEFYDVPHKWYAAEGFDHGAWDYRLRGRNLKRLSLDFLNEYLLGIADKAFPFAFEPLTAE